MFLRTPLDLSDLAAPKMFWIWPELLSIKASSGLLLLAVFEVQIICWWSCPRFLFLKVACSRLICSYSRSFSWVPEDSDYDNYFMVSLFFSYLSLLIYSCLLEVSSRLSNLLVFMNFFNFLYSINDSLK